MGAGSGVPSAGACAGTTGAPGAAGVGPEAVTGTGPGTGAGAPGAGGFLASCRICQRQMMIGAAVISSANDAQMIMAGWLCPKMNDATTEAPNTAMKNRWMRNVPNSVSGLAESPFGVTTNLLLRRSTASMSERA